ncbi:hypothetical protein DNH61_05645 [Paenibacillus sambharensis]|uniref:Fibronectin type-III domain-containing protein n=1 Tax=Paenibacillus sambharensis TaxID=1803190 RepID=A0A2W1LP93_9BACL|nr:S8 family serine peptidase [Paenibacillus sambharensis]PZD96685.1 hypothetical protein DNH61_05645 [Paenibacillus sambharensis]
MKMKSAKITAAVLTLSLLLQASWVQAEAAYLPGTAEQEVIIVYKNEEGKEAARNESQDIRHEFDVVPAVAASVTNDQLAELINDPNIALIERNITFSTTGSDVQQLNSSEIIPAEQSQWGFQAVKSSNKWADGFTGAGVKVAVLDSGIAPHPDLIVAGGVSTVDYTASYTDDEGHGTHVAGIIAARRGNGGMVGIAPDAQLYAVKVMDANGQGTLLDVMEGIEWSIQNGMHILNISLGTDTYSPSLHSMVDLAHQHGIVLVGSAGNSGSGVNTINYPAKLSNVIAVSAIDVNRNRGDFSSTGAENEVAAPGVDILSTYLNNMYASGDGTSQAAPHVAGMLAILKQMHPAYTNEQLRSQLHKYAIDLGAPGRDDEYGIGFSTFTKDIVPPGEVSGLKVSAVTDSSVTMEWTKPADPDLAAAAVYLNGSRLGSVTSSVYQAVDLAPATTYTFKVTTSDTSGNESAGTTIQATTLPAALKQPGEPSGTAEPVNTEGEPPAEDSAPAPGTGDQPADSSSGDSSQIPADSSTAEGGSQMPDGDEQAGSGTPTVSPIIVQPAPVSNPVVPGPIMPMPFNPTPPPSGGSSVVTGGDADPAAGDNVERTVPSDPLQKAQRALSEAAASRRAIDYAAALAAVHQLPAGTDKAKLNRELAAFKTKLGIRDLPGRSAIHSGIPLSVSLQVAAGSGQYKYIDASSITDDNVFIMDDTGKIIRDVKVSLLWNRLFVSPGSGELDPRRTYTLYLDKSVRGKASPGGAARELPHPAALPFTVGKAAAGDTSNGSAAASGKTAFKDTAGHWARDTIQWAITTRMVTGYGDGSFRPNQPVTEAEFLAMLLRAFEPELVSSGSGHWAGSYYSRARELQYPALGYSSTEARKRTIQRQQVAELISSAEGVRFEGDHAVRYILAFGLANGSSSTKVTVESFQGSKGLTRAEALQFVRNFTQYGIGGLLERPAAPSNPADIPPIRR